METEGGYVSTGDLPRADRVAAVVAAAHRAHRDEADGHVSEVYPALGRADPGLFGICVAGVDGLRAAAGDASVPFTIMSVAKPFVFALACDAHGPDAVRDIVGVNATGLPFNAAEAVERGPGGRTNPMVNPGAIATTGLVPGRGPDGRWRAVLDGLSRFAGRDLGVDGDVLASARATNHRNRALARLLTDAGRITGDPDEVVDLYTRQSCVAVTAEDLAVMGATLADGGVNPSTRERVVSAEACRWTLAVMATAGLYETSGDWLVDVGLPGKSGIGGGMVTVSPGKGALGTFSPPLDPAGNSVRGLRVAREMSRALGLDIFASAPARPAA